MRDPQEALQAARAAAAGQAREPSDPGDQPLHAGADLGRRLTRWAIIQPERTEIYSTRRLGAPITWFKRLLIRLLSQYFNQLTAQQSRFNADVAAHVIALEQRVRELEARDAHRADPDLP